MRLGNADDARTASEQIGTEHRFVLSQLTDTVGTSVTDTVGDSYTSTVGTADSVSASATTSQTSGRSRGRSRSHESIAAPFGRETSSRSGDQSYSSGTSDSESITEGINLSTAWGVSTSRAVGTSDSLARTTQRSREFLVEQHELQQLPPSAVIISSASRRGRQVVMADANPGIIGLPGATLLSLDEARNGADAPPTRRPPAAPSRPAPARRPRARAGELAVRRRAAAAEPRPAAGAAGLAQAARLSLHWAATRPAPGRYLAIPVAPPPAAWYARCVGGQGSLVGPWHRILAITAPAGADSPESDFVAVLPAVLSAAGRGRAFAVGWLSRGAGAPLELITNAGALPGAGPEPGSGESPGLLFPGGARGVLIGDDWLAELDRMVWTCCPGRQAPALAEAGRPDRREQDRRPTLFESTLVTLMGRRFGWLVIAEPTGLIEAEIAELRTQLNVLRRYDEERSRFDVDRAQRRMAELDTFREAGLWSVRVLAGAATAEELRLIAPVLAGSVDLSKHPYRLRGGLEPHRLAEALTVKVQDATDGAATPFPATAGPLAALAGLPRREIPGLRVLDPGYFDVTSETEGPDRPGPASPLIEVGAILDPQDRPAGAFRVPLATLNRHAFVTGATGAGKSQTVRHILEQCGRAGLPWLAIEPAKSEYAAMAGRLAGITEVTVINPTDPRAVPLSVNPLAP